LTRYAVPPILVKLKQHNNALRNLLEGLDYLCTNRNEESQDVYLLRCMPQVHGACTCADAIVTARRIVEIELNSATDNPLIFINKNTGYLLPFWDKTFMVSLWPWHLTISRALAMTKYGKIFERLSNRLIDVASNNDILPLFLTDDSGLNSGFMLTQYQVPAMAAAALASENKALCWPASCDFIPTSAIYSSAKLNGCCDISSLFLELNSLLPPRVLISDVES
jgi:histidine ammonia-lyase